MAMPTLLQQLSQQIEGMNVQSINENDLVEAKQRQQFAEHNLCLEALYLTADEKQLIELLLDKGLPFDKYKPLLEAFLIGVLSDENWQKYQHPSKQSTNFQQWADYFEPDTQEKVLKNRYGITQSESLEVIERLWVAIRHQTLPSITFDSQGLQQLHQHLFGDIYPWAGQFRQVSMGKGTSSFVKPALIGKQLEQIFKQLAKDHYLQGLDRPAFIHKLTQLLGDINNVHPFRDGNGRTIRAFIWRLAKQAGYPLDFSYITQERMIQASIDYANGKPATLQAIIDEITDPQAVKMASSFHQFLQKAKGLTVWNGLFIANMQDGERYTGTFIGKNAYNFTVQLADSSIVVGDIGRMPIGSYKSGDTITVMTEHKPDSANG